MKKINLPKYSALSLAMFSLLATESIYGAANRSINPTQLATPPICGAGNFCITPVQSFPVHNTATGVLPVYYTVTNLTGSPRNGYSVVGLPPNVVQFTDINHCSNPINLASGHSCTLQLNVTGTVANAGFALANGSSVTTASSPMDVTLLTQTLQVSVGQNIGSNLPILFQSQDVGVSWLDFTLPALPIDPADTGLLRSASCQGSVCVAVGEEINGGNHDNLIAQTQNGGDVWSYITGLSNGGLNAVSASTAKTFVAVGVGPGGTNEEILISSDNGQTWAAPTTLPVIGGTLNSVGCSGLLCVATSEATAPPQFLQSLDGGHTWSSVTVTGGVVVTAGLLNGASCSGNTCIVVGEDQTGGTKQPLIGQTTNGGGAWSWIHPITVIADGLLLGAQCNSSGCTAVGYADDAAGHTMAPFITQSIGGGAWTHNTYVTTTGAVYGFHSVSCNGSSCVAVGDDNVDAQVGPYTGIIAQFTLGTTWDNTYTTLSSALTNTTYASVTCGSSICFAAGQSQTTSNPPFIAQNINNGGWGDANIDTTLVPTGTLNGTASGN